MYTLNSLARRGLTAAFSAIAVIVASLVPVAPAAASGPAPCTTSRSTALNTKDGNATNAGQASNPFIIANADDLVYLSLNQTAQYMSAHFEQTGNVNLGGCLFRPIGVGGPSWSDSFDAVEIFSGTYLGSGFSVSNLTIRDGSLVEVPGGLPFAGTRNAAGLFGGVRSPAVIRDLALLRVDVEVSSDRVGSLVGYSYGDPTIERVFVSGRVVGANTVGGVIGEVSWYADVRDIYSRAHVSGSSLVGGVIGKFQNSNSDLRRWVFSGTVAGGTAHPFIAESPSSAMCVDCFFDSDRTGIASATGGTPKTSAQLRQQTTYTNFDFASGTPVWKISPNQNDGFATLSFQTAASYLPTISTITPGKTLSTEPTDITIIGFDFEDLVSVSAGGSALAIVSANATAIVATVPAGSVGPLDIVVTTNRGSSARPGAVFRGGPDLLSTRGNDFWLTFDRNSSLANSNQLIYISSEVDATATVTWPDATTSTVNLIAGVTATVDAKPKLTVGNSYLVNQAFEGIANHAIRVNSAATISVYGINFQRATTDAFAVVPTSALGTEHIAVVYSVSGTSLQSDNARARISVVASEPGQTILTITPSVALRQQIGGAGVRPAGAAYTVSLQQGEVYTVTTDANNTDPTGTEIASDKKVGVFTSTYMNSHPLGLSGAADYIYEMMTPVDAWGKDFIAVSAPNSFSSRRDVYRILASADNTNLLIGAVPVVLQRGQVHEFELPGFATRVVSADKPVYIMHFVSGGSFALPTSGTTSGDPAMVKLVPTTQFLNSYVITTPAVNFRTNFALLTVRQAEKGLVTRGGFAIGADAFTDVAGTDYAVARIPIALGTHYFRAPSGFGLVVAGMDDADSYAYPGGFGLVDLAEYPGGVAELQGLQQPTAPFSVGNNLVAGHATICSTLSVSEGGWTDGGSSITSTSYQWIRNGVPIGGATNSTLSTSGFNPGDLIAFEIRKTNAVGTTSATSKPVQLQHPGLVGLNTSAGDVTPSVSVCETSYAVSTNQPWIAVTANLFDEAASLTIAGQTNLSGSPSNQLTLQPGANVIEIVVTSGIVTSSYTLNVTYVEGPGVQILAPTSISNTDVTLNATVFGRGNQPSGLSFELVAAAPGDNIAAADFTSATVVAASVANPQTGTQQVSVIAAGLIQAQRYFVRARLSAASYSDVFSLTFEFTTRAAPSAVTTPIASNTAIGSDFRSVTIQGSINPNGSATDGFLSWSLNSDMSAAVEEQVLTARTGSTTVAMSRVFSNIPVGATIYFQARATNAFGTNFGTIHSFVMKAPTSFSTPVVVSLSATEATLEVGANPNNSTTDILCFRRVTGQPTSNSSGCNAATAPNVISGNEFRLARGTLTGLTPNTTYSVQAYARNYPRNSLEIAYSSWVTFTTPAAASGTLTASVEGPASVGPGDLIFLTYRFSAPAVGFDKTKVVLSGASAGWTTQQVVEVTPELYTLEVRPDSNVVAGTTLVIESLDPPATAAGGGNFSQISNLSVDVVSTAPNITYASSPLSLNQFDAMAAASPTNSGGTASAWSVNPALPAGLSLSASGVISGTPQSAQVSTNYTVTATNSVGSSSTVIAIEVAASALQPANFTLTPTGYSFEVGQAITSIVPLSTGGAVDLWSVSPSLPAGLSLNTATGVISGTPTAFGAARVFQLSASNAAGSKSVGITISVFEIAPSYSASAALTQAIQFQPITAITPVAAAGVATSYFLSSSLPTGLSFNFSTGVVSGTPAGTRLASNANVSTFTVTASNSAGSSAYSFQIQIMAAVPDFSYPSRSVNVGSVMSTASPTLSATSGAVTSYSISPALPTGLSFNTTSGAISGTPSVLLAQTDFTITATNAAGSATSTFTLTVINVQPNFTFSPTSVTANELQAMSPRTPNVTAGREITWSISPALPAGLVLNSTTGTISGTPSAGSKISATSFVLTATNSVGLRNLTITITVTDNPILTFTVPATNLNLTESLSSVDITPTVTFGNPTNWTISPALPSGLSLNSTTGQIAGTPVRGSRITLSGFLLSASDGVSSFEVQLDLEIQPRPISFAYASISYVFEETVAITPVAPAAPDAMPLSFSISPALPAGLVFDSATGVISGTADEGTEQIATTYTITGIDGALSYSFDIEIEIAEAPPAPTPQNLGPGSGSASYFGPVIQGFSPSVPIVGQAVRMFGLKLETISRVTIGGIEVRLSFVSATEVGFTLPASLGAGTYSVVIESSFGRLTLQDGLTLRVDRQPRAFSSAQFASTPDIAGATRRVSHIKVYARDLVGAGKVQLLVNGVEIAWVRAVDATDPKLNVRRPTNLSSAMVPAADGIVRSVYVRDLKLGRNVIEVYLDGKRIMRRIFTR